MREYSTSPSRDFVKRTNSIIHFMCIIFISWAHVYCLRIKHLCNFPDHVLCIRWIVLYGVHPEYTLVDLAISGCLHIHCMVATHRIRQFIGALSISLWMSLQGAIIGLMSSIDGSIIDSALFSNMNQSFSCLLDGWIVHQTTSKWLTIAKISLGVWCKSFDSNFMEMWASVL